jgi:subtilase family serine protease
MSISFMLTLNNPSELDQELANIYDPASSSFHHFLSPNEFRAKYSPTQAQIDEIKSSLASQGIVVTSVNDNRTLVSSSASVGAINSAFHTEIHSYKNQAGATFHAPAYELQISEALPVQAILGLQNMVTAKRHLVKNSAKANVSVSGFTPAGIRSAYNLPSSVSGAGQTLALFELDGYTASDVTAYETEFSLTQVPLKNVLVNGSTGSAGDGADEVTLDIELMAAVAPGASAIMVYEGTNDETGMLATYDKIASDNIAKQVSSSWGSTEATGSFANSENTIFQQMSAQGQSMYAAAGDDGADDNGSNLSVGDPASQPYVVGVGGTSLTVSSSGAYQSEKTWDDSSASAGGGGISVVWTIPSWQSGHITTASKGSTTMRNVPDVSLNADPDTGYAIYYGGSWTEFGGTSCAAPLWAAFNALVNQQRVSNGTSDLGFPNPSLYAIGTGSSSTSDFHDVADGSTNQYYPAVTGFDDATGWGSFNGTNLFDSLTQGALGTTGSGGSCS